MSKKKAENKEALKSEALSAQVDEQVTESVEETKEDDTDLTDDAEGEAEKLNAEVAPENKDNKSVEEAKKELDMMKRLNVSTLIKNSKGEYFTNENLAVLSEMGKKDKLKSLSKDALEFFVKTQS